MKKNFDNLIAGAILAKQDDDSIILEKIMIREDLKALIPPLSDEEYQQLRESISKEGVRDPIILWSKDGSYIIVDGHNRYAICQEMQKKFPHRILVFDNDSQAKDWMINNQLGRRNLSQEQMSYLRGLKYNSNKAQGKRTDLTLDQNDPKFSLSTAASLAREYNVGEATIKRDGEFANALDKVGASDPTLKKEILSGKSKLNRKDILGMASNGLTKTDKGNTERKRADVSWKKLVEIAMTYITSEKRSIEEVSKILGFELDDMEPAKFLIKWNAERNNNL